MTEEDDQEEVELVRDWIGRLEAFASSLDDIEGDDATDFCDNACEAWQHIAMSSVTQQNPAALLIFEALNALAKASTTVIMDWADTPDVRDRYTRETAQQLVKDVLGGVGSISERWLSEGLPSADEIQQRFTAVTADIKESMDVLGKRTAEMDGQDAEAAADPYGAILIYDDPNRDPSLIFEKVFPLTEDEDKRYRDAYERLRRMVDSELLEHISDESKRFCDQLIAVLTDLRDNQISLFDADAWDEHRRKVRSALISFTAALQIHQEQTINAAKKTFGRKTPQLAAVEQLFTDLRKSSFEYGWLEEMRDALQHGDINAFKWGFGASMRGEPTANVYMSREFMLKFTSRAGNKPWLKRRELQDMDSDPSVLEMIKAIRPLMGPFQEKLDKIMYPNVTEDVATVRELLSRFPGRQGLHALQNGPGFTRRNLGPPISPLAPRVLHFVATFEPDAQDEQDEQTSAVVDSDD
jgi:hypothetical protein